MSFHQLGTTLWENSLSIFQTCLYTTPLLSTWVVNLRETKWRCSSSGYRLWQPHTNILLTHVAPSSAVLKYYFVFLRLTPANIAQIRLETGLFRNPFLFTAVDSKRVKHKNDKVGKSDLKFKKVKIFDTVLIDPKFCSLLFI